MVHSVQVLYKKCLGKRIYFRLFEARIIKNAQAVQFLGQTQYDYIDKLIKLNNKVLIPKGQNLEELDFQAEARSSSIIPFSAIADAWIEDIKDWISH